VLAAAVWAAAARGLAQEAGNAPAAAPPGAALTATALEAPLSLPPGPEAAQQAPALGDSLTAAGTTQASPIPYMLGNSLRPSGAINFSYALDRSNISGSSANNDVGPGAPAKIPILHRFTDVAEDNNAFPADRFSYQYDFFSNGSGLVGLSGQLGPTGLPPSLPAYRPLSRDVFHDVSLHTFAYEQSFADGLFSLETRLPFAFGLSNRLNLSAGRITGDQVFSIPGTDYYALQVDPTARNTWGGEGWELQDVSEILKIAIYQDPARDLCFAGGLQVVAPTARNMNVQVTDYWEQFLPFYPPAGIFVNLYNGRRTRTFHIENDTWTLSPFLALSMKPTPRTFFNGFLQLDVPLGSDTVEFSQIYETTYTVPYLFRIPVPNLAPMQENFRGSLRDQVAMQLDLAVGYWLYQNPEARWLKGLAPTLELHLLQTLQNGQVLQLPVSTLYQATPAGVVLEPAPTVGNAAANTTLTDVTFGVTGQIGNASSFGVGGSVPLGIGHDRTASSALHLQLDFWF
jgi:hypothetical protein